MTPIASDEFEKKGIVPKVRRVQDAIMKMLQGNPNQAFSSAELQELTKARAESVNQALRTLEGKGFIERGLVTGDNNRKMIYARISKEHLEKLRAEGEVKG